MAVPGAGYVGYYQLKEIIDKGVLQAQKILFEFRDGLVYADGKVLQGLKVYDENVQITGVHYTSWEMATQIRSMERIEPSLDDPFVYISEPGKMEGWPEELIKKELGASIANTKVSLQVIVPVERVWIKTSRDVVHYAISGILSEIVKLRIKRI